MYSTALSDTNIDSTVLPTVAGDTAMCYSTSSCPVSGLTSASSGCLSEDTYLVGVSQGGMSMGTTIGIAVGASLGGMLVVAFICRRWRQRRVEAESSPPPFNKAQSDMSGFVPMGNNDSSMGMMGSPNMTMKSQNSSSSMVSSNPMMASSPSFSGYPLAPLPIQPPPLAAIVAMTPTPAQALEDRLFSYYQVYDTKKTRADARTVVAHFLSPGKGGEARLNDKLFSKYGARLPAGQLPDI